MKEEALMTKVPAVACPMAEDEGNETSGLTVLGRLRTGRLEGWLKKRCEASRKKRVGYYLVSKEKRIFAELSLLRRSGSNCAVGPFQPTPTPPNGGKMTPALQMEGEDLVATKSLHTLLWHKKTGSFLQDSPGIFSFSGNCSLNEANTT